MVRSMMNAQEAQMNRKGKGKGKKGKKGKGGKRRMGLPRNGGDVHGRCEEDARDDERS